MDLQNQNVVEQQTAPQPQANAEVKKDFKAPSGYENAQGFFKDFVDAIPGPLGDVGSALFNTEEYRINRERKLSMINQLRDEQAQRDEELNGIRMRNEELRKNMARDDERWERSTKMWNLEYDDKLYDMSKKYGTEQASNVLLGDKAYTSLTEANKNAVATSAAYHNYDYFCRAMNLLRAGGDDVVKNGGLVNTPMVRSIVDTMGEMGFGIGYNGEDVTVTVVRDGEKVTLPLTTEYVAELKQTLADELAQTVKDVSMFDPSTAAGLMNGEANMYAANSLISAGMRQDDAYKSFKAFWDQRWTEDNRNEFAMVMCYDNYKDSDESGEKLEGLRQQAMSFLKGKNLEMLSNGNVRDDYGVVDGIKRTYTLQELVDTIKRNNPMCQQFESIRAREEKETAHDAQMMVAREAAAANEVLKSEAEAEYYRSKKNEQKSEIENDPEVQRDRLYEYFGKNTAVYGATENDFGTLLKIQRAPLAQIYSGLGISPQDVPVEEAFKMLTEPENFGLLEEVALLEKEIAKLVEDDGLKKSLRLPINDLFDQAKRFSEADLRAKRNYDESYRNEVKALRRERDRAEVKMHEKTKRDLSTNSSYYSSYPMGNLESPSDIDTLRRVSQAMVDKANLDNIDAKRAKVTGVTIEDLRRFNRKKAEEKKSKKGKEKNKGDKKSK